MCGFWRKSLLRQNPHTYWGVLKNYIWYLAGMAEGAHPMVTGFFRLKDRRQRRPGLPLESRWTFFRRRTRDVACTLRAYARIFVTMQELWLATRIRRDEYAFLGDLRKLAARSRQEAKLNWAWVHAVIGERLVAMRGSVGQQASHATTATMERLDAMRTIVAARASALGTSVGDRANAVRASMGTSLTHAGRSLSLRAAAVQHALSDLRLKYPPPAARPSWFRRAAARLNVFSIQHVEPRGGLTDYWQRTWAITRRLQLWRLNPVEVTWHLARDARHAVIFFFAMMYERY